MMAAEVVFERAPSVMAPATWPREDPASERLLLVDPARRALDDRRVGQLPSVLRAGDVLVVNDAATLPAAVRAQRGSGGPELELRLFDVRTDEEGRVQARAIVLGDGDHHMPTEERGPPPELRVGEALVVGDGLSAMITRVESPSARAVGLCFGKTTSARVFSGLYASGRPIQYAYIAGELSLWHVQSSFGSRPWATEMPSAGRPLTWKLLSELRRNGVDVARVTHGAGLSSTGDAALDRQLPLPERYAVPPRTAALIERARARRGLVVAAGTSVVRALEASARATGRPTAAEGTTDLLVTGATPVHSVDAVLTGMHEPGTSHFRLLEAFADETILRAAFEHANRRGYLLHEFGDSMLVLGHRGGRAIPARW